MNRDEPYARCFRTARQFWCIDRAVVPTETHLEGYWHRNRGHRRVDQADRMVEITHQRRSRLAIGDVPRRAAHVDINDGGAAVHRDAGALRHPLCLATGDLNY